MPFGFQTDIFSFSVAIVERKTAWSLWTSYQQYFSSWRGLELWYISTYCTKTSLETITDREWLIIHIQFYPQGTCWPNIVHQNNTHWAVLLVIYLNHYLLFYNTFAIVDVWDESTTSPEAIIHIFIIYLTWWPHRRNDTYHSLCHIRTIAFHCDTQLLSTLILNEVD